MDRGLRVRVRYIYTWHTHTPTQLLTCGSYTKRSQASGSTVGIMFIVLVLEIINK